MAVASEDARYCVKLKSYYYQSTQLIKKLQKEKASQTEILPALQSQECQGACLCYKCLPAWPSLFPYCGASGNGWRGDSLRLEPAVLHNPELISLLLHLHKQTPIAKFCMTSGAQMVSCAQPLFAEGVHRHWFWCAPPAAANHLMSRLQWRRSVQSNAAAQ